jgi:hypothetical protein
MWTCRNPWLWLSSATPKRQWDCVDETICTWSVRLKCNMCLKKFTEIVSISVNVQCSSTIFMQCSIWTQFTKVHGVTSRQVLFFQLWNYFLHILINREILQFQINSFLSTDSIMLPVWTLFCVDVVHILSL